MDALILGQNWIKTFKTASPTISETLSIQDAIDLAYCRRWGWTSTICRVWQPVAIDCLSSCTFVRIPRVRNKWESWELSLLPFPIALLCLKFCLLFFLLAIFYNCHFPIISTTLNLKNMIVNHFFFSFFALNVANHCSYRDTNTNLGTCLHINMRFKKL